MGLFGSTYNATDPQRLRVAAHELGHAWVWKSGGLKVGTVTAARSGGSCPVRWYSRDLHAYAVGCWGGFEAEDRWLREHKLGRAARGNSGHDIDEFQAAVKELGGGLPESNARRLARDLVSRHWNEITRLTPALARAGRITV
jgi:hypothetical protein